MCVIGVGCELDNFFGMAFRVPEFEILTHPHPIQHNGRKDMAIISPLEYEDGDARDAGGSSSSAPASAAAPTPAPAPVPAPSASASSSTSTSASAGTRAPPPRAAQNHEELMSAFDSTPLFMRNLPEEEGNTAFEALQSLTHDGTPDGMYSTVRPAPSGALD